MAKKRIVDSVALEEAIKEMAGIIKPVVISQQDFIEIWSADSADFLPNEPEDEYFDEEDLESYLNFSAVPPNFTIVAGGNAELAALFGRIKDACINRQGFCMVIHGYLSSVLLQHDFTDSDEYHHTRFKPIFNPATGEFFMPKLSFNDRVMDIFFQKIPLLPAVPPSDNCLYGIKNGAFVKICDSSQILLATSRQSARADVSMPDEGNDYIVLDDYGDSTNDEADQRETEPDLSTMKNEELSDE